MSNTNQNTQPAPATPETEAESRSERMRREAVEDALEAAYWTFDTRRRDASRSERDSFKTAVRRHLIAHMDQADREQRAALAMLRDGVAGLASRLGTALLGPSHEPAAWAVVSQVYAGLRAIAPGRTPPAGPAGDKVQVGSVVVEKSASGMRIGTVHGNHRPGEVERADIRDLHAAIGTFMEMKASEASYAEHVAPRQPPDRVPFTYGLPRGESASFETATPRPDAPFAPPRALTIAEVRDRLALRLLERATQDLENGLPAEVVALYVNAFETLMRAR